MAIRNPFDRWTNSMPKPKTFGMPNQGGGSHQIFARYQAPESPQTPQQDMTGGWGSYLDELKDVYTKQGPAAAAYNEHLTNLPEYQNPSKMHKFGSALVGAAEGYRSGGGSGWAAGQEALHSPYRRSLDEWGMKEQALGRSVEQEDKASGRRLSYMKEVGDSIKDENERAKWMRDFDIKDAAQKSTEKHQRAQEENWAAQGFVKDYDAQGNIIFLNPRTGEQKSFGPSSKKTDWAFDERRVRSGEVSAGAAASNAATNRGRLDVYSRDVNADNTRADRTQERLESQPISPDDQAKARSSALNRASLENPEWSKFLDPEGNVNPKTRWKNPDGYDQFMERVMEHEDLILGTRRRGIFGKSSQEYEY